jgi:hypothetical protein
MASAQSVAKPKAVGHGAATAIPALQAKLEVGGAGDHYEREADCVARQVMRGGDAPAIAPSITPLGAQRKKAAAPAPKKEEEPKGKGAKVQRKPAASVPKVDENKKKAQRKESGAGGGMASPGVESSIARMKGSGSTLDGGTRSFMESRFGRDFGGVRVHNGAAAASAASALDARAFTVGQDVFFNAGEYQPGNAAGRELIAHELTHTVQQGGGGGVAAPKRIQRVPTPPGGSGATPVGPGAPPVAATKMPMPANRELAFNIQENGAQLPGTLSLEQQQIDLPVLRLPLINGTLKGCSGGTAGGADAAANSGGRPPRMGGAWSFRAVGPRPAGAASEKWMTATRSWTGDLERQLRALVTPQAQRFDGDRYMLGFQQRSAAKDAYFIFGTLNQIAQSRIILIPNWTKTSTEPARPTRGGIGFFDVDHILEWQLGGADTIDNFWLLESSFNQAIGGTINRAINSDINAALTNVRATYDTSGVTVPDGDTVRSSWRVNFAQTVQAYTRSNTFWTRSEIQSGQQLAPLKLLTAAEISQRGFRPMTAGANPTELSVFPSEVGGRRKEFTVRADGRIQRPSNPEVYRNMDFLDGIYRDDGTNIGAIRIQFFKNVKNASGPIVYINGVAKEPVIREVHIKKIDPFFNVGYFSKQDVYSASQSLNIAGFSPLALSMLELNTEGDLMAGGELTATKALFPNLRVTVSIVGDSVRLNFPVPIAQFRLGPVTVTTLDMALGYGAQGPLIEGSAGFEIAGLGEGSVTASVSRAGPQIAGAFNFAVDFFNPASLAATYNFATDEFRVAGTLGVQSGRIPGVESGTITVAITRETIDVAGTINLGGPLRGTVVNVGYTREAGLVIGAENIPLPFASLPAVQNATMSIGAARSPEGVWSFSGAGTATLAVPGATGTIDIAYRDGLVTLHANAQVEKGPASGTLTFTATNGPIDEEGNPVEGPATDTISAWGRGSVTVRFGNVLQGTAEIEYTPDNRIILSGTIAMPPVYEVFARREFNRDLLHIEPPEFPIWGVSVAGIGVGIFAFVDARISFNAYVGPGQIRDAAITAEMDLDHPELATIHGHGQFFVPAYAGLNLNVGGGLRARVAVAYAEGRVGLEGQLGIEADASATVDFDWNPTSGLALEATFAANARPKFELFANASVTVGVDLLVTDVSHTFGPWRRELGSFGPDMELGVEFPVRWSEANGLDLSLDNIVVHEPSLDAPALMGSVFDRLAP